MINLINGLSKDTLDNKCYLFNKSYCYIAKSSSDVYNLHFHFWSLYHPELGNSNSCICSVSLDAQPSFVEFITDYFNSNRRTYYTYSGTQKNSSITPDEAYSLFMYDGFAYEVCGEIASQYIQLLKSINPSWIIDEKSSPVYGLCEECE